MITSLFFSIFQMSIDKLIILCFGLIVEMFYFIPKAEFDYKNEVFIIECSDWYKENMPCLPKEFWRGTRK